jgi:Selenocysteine lyase
MIYFDNAATTRIKPDEVMSAFIYYMRDIGVSPGRGSYSLGIQASRMLFQSRKAVAAFFGSNHNTNVLFTKNSTEAINLYFNGTLQQGDHVLISSYEHNAVLRPLHSLKQKGIIDYTVLPQSVFDNPSGELHKYIKSTTKLAAITLASNLTGQVVFNNRFSSECKSNGITVFVDASQGGGKGLINMGRDNIDCLAFTGHKDLLAMPGVGGLCTLEPLTIPPLIQGGTGIHGDSYVNPCVFPEAYESGTLNMPAIWSLKAAIEHINPQLVRINEREKQLTAQLLTGLLSLDNIVVYKPECNRVSTVCFNVKNTPSSEVVTILDRNNICVRGGIHCAILAHETLGTVQLGAVRVSLNYMNTEDEIDTLLKIIRGIK